MKHQKEKEIGAFFSASAQTPVSLNKKPKYKILWFGAVVVLAGWSAWWMLARALYVENVAHPWAIPLLAFIVYVIILGILLVAFYDKKLLVTVSGISLAGYFLFIGREPLSAVFFAVALILCWIAIERAQNEKQSLVLIKPTRILRVPLALVITAVSILVSVGYYHSLGNGGSSLAHFEPKISESQMGLITNAIGNALPKGIREMTSDITADEYLAETILGSAEKQDKEKGKAAREEFENLDPQGKEELLREPRRELEEQFGIGKVQGNEPMREILTRIINVRIAEFFNAVPRAATFAPILLAAGFFLTLKAIGIFTKGLLNLLVSGLLWILVKLQVFEIKRKMKEVEYII